MEVAPLLRELILRTVERVGLDSRVAHDVRMIGLLEDEVKAAMAAANDPNHARRSRCPCPATNERWPWPSDVLAQPSM